MSLAPRSYDIPLNLAANDYQYEDCTVIIYVGNETFKIGRSRLAQRSPVFRELFQLKQPVSPASDAFPILDIAVLRGPEPVFDHPSASMLDPVAIPLPASPRVQSAEPIVLHLHNDPEDFKHYLWAIHADFIDADEFNNEEASQSKCARLLGIASVAHMYEVTSMANRALEDALRMLESYQLHIDQDLARRIVHTTRRWADQPEIAARGRTILRTAMESYSIDTFGLILIAETLEDTELLGWGYYYLLRLGERSWTADGRVRSIDRRRLLCGAFALATKWQTICAQYGGQSPSHIPAWAIFEKMDYISHWNRPGKADIERDLYSFFDPAPWNL